MRTIMIASGDAENEEISLTMEPDYAVLEMQDIPVIVKRFGVQLLGVRNELEKRFAPKERYRR